MNCDSETTSHVRDGRSWASTFPFRSASRNLRFGFPAPMIVHPTDCASARFLIFPSRAIPMAGTGGLCLLWAYKRRNYFLEFSDASPPPLPRGRFPSRGPVLSSRQGQRQILRRTSRSAGKMEFGEATGAAHSGETLFLKAVRRGSLILSSPGGQVILPPRWRRLVCRRKSTTSR